MIHPNIFKPKNDWNVRSLYCKKYNAYQEINLITILARVSELSGIPVEVLKLNTRKRDVVEARHIFFKRACEGTRETLETIGKYVGRDHASVLHGVSQVNNIKYLSDRYDVYFNGKTPEVRIVSKIKKWELHTKKYDVANYDNLPEIKLNKPAKRPYEYPSFRSQVNTVKAYSYSPSYQ